MTNAGSAEIWAAHQEHMHKLYMERIYETKRGACHGYYDQTEPGTVDEYGERFACYYNNKNGTEDFQFLFLGWWQGGCRLEGSCEVMNFPPPP